MPLCSIARRRYDARFVAAALDQDSQSDPRQLVGERDCQNVAMQTPGRSREPGSKAMLFPTLGSEQNGAGALDEEHTQIAVSALRDAAKDRAITGRHLFRHQAKPRGKVSPFCKSSSIADRRDHGAGNDRADARNTHQLPTVHVGACQSLDLVCYLLDTIV